MRISDWSSDVCSSDLGLWPCRGEHQRRSGGGGEAQPRGGETAQPGRHAPDEEEQDRGAYGRWQAHRARQAGSEGREGQRNPDREAYPRRDRPPPPPPPPSPPHPPAPLDPPSPPHPP